MTGRREVFDQAMSQGHSAAWDQYWDRAIASYTSALKEFPDDSTALTSLGYALLQSDRLDEALRVYQRAATLTPGDPVAPEKCGELFERLGRLNDATQTYLAVAEMHLARRDIEKAIDNWSRAIRLTPDNLNAHSRLALALERTGKTHEAVLEYLEVARLFQRANSPDKANQAVSHVLQLEPQSPQAREALDKLRKGQPLPVPARRPGTGPLAPREAARPQAAPKAEPEEPESHGNSPLESAKEIALARLAEMLFEEDADTSKTSASMGAITKGTGPLRGSPAKRAQAVMYLGQAINHQTADDREAAVSNYQSALDAGLNHASIHFMLGALYLDLNRPDEAVKSFKQATAHDDFNLGAYYGLGQAFQRQGQLQNALRNLLEALKILDLRLSQNQPERQNRLAESYESLVDAVQNIADAEKSTVVQSLLRFMSGDRWEDNARRARKQLDGSAENGQVTPLADMLATPGADRIMESMGRIDRYIRHKYWGTAMEEAYRALEISPTHLPIHVRMAEILIAENKPQAAIAKYAVVADSYRMRGDVGRAARILEDVLRLSPLDIEVRIELIELLTEQGKTEAALEQYLELGDTYYQLTDLDTAYSTFSTGLRLAQKAGADPKWGARLLHRLGDIDLQRLAWKDALRHYEQIRMLAPNDEKARAQLIEIYLRMGDIKQARSELDSFLRLSLAAGHAAAAITVLEELVNHYPDEPALVARLARLYQDQGRRAEAIAQYDRLGELHLNAGENAQAAETIRTILALGPDDVAGYQQLLAQIQEQRS